MSDVIQFMTSEQRQAKVELQEKQAYNEEAHAEAITMLEDALRFAREEKSLTAVAIAYSFADGRFATQVPSHGNQMGALAGAVATMGFRIHLLCFS